MVWCLAGEGSESDADRTRGSRGEIKRAAVVDYLEEVELPTHTIGRAELCIKMAQWPRTAVSDRDGVRRGQWAREEDVQRADPGGR
jgi:hypothetical protein